MTNSLLQFYDIQWNGYAILSSWISGWSNVQISSKTNAYSRLLNTIANPRQDTRIHSPNACRTSCQWAGCHQKPVSTSQRTHSLENSPCVKRPRKNGPLENLWKDCKKAIKQCYSIIRCTLEFWYDFAKVHGHDTINVDGIILATNFYAHCLLKPE